MYYEDIKIIIDQLNVLIENINQRFKNLNIENKFNEISEIKNDENFWKREDSSFFLKESKKIENLFEKQKEINKKFLFLKEIFEVANESDFEEIFIDFKNLMRDSKEFSIKLLMNEEDDNKNCYFDINSGAGGTEAQDWAEIVLRMYLRFFERNFFKYDLIDFSPGEEAGIKSATIFVKGDFINGILQSEIGIHRLVRISPFDSNKRRHTSFCAVNVTPEAPEINIIIDPKDLRVDTYRAGGAGGQHVNKTDSAVRITHIPTGIVVQCQNERSQLQNKESAMKVLKARLYKREKEMQNEKASSAEKKKIEWGSQIRSYVLHPYKMVKDHRTDFESQQPEKVLDGELIDFIEKYLIMR